MQACIAFVEGSVAVASLHRVWPRVSGALQAAEASGSEEEAPAETAPGEEEREEGEIVPPVDKKAQRLQARRAAAQAAADELKVCLPSAFHP